MGIQIHSSKEYKTAVKLVQSGAIGKIKEVHSWSEKKWGDSWFDPFAFAPVNAPRFGTAGFHILRAPGLVNFDSSIFRDFRSGERWKLQFRAEAFNISNTPHFAGPGSNVSSLQLNADGSLRNLNGYTVINGVQNTGREGVDERMFRFALRLSF